MIQLTQVLIGDGNGDVRSVDGTTYQATLQATDVANFTELLATVNAARQAIHSASIGMNWGQISQAAVDQLSDAIRLAVIVTQNQFQQQAIVDQAANDLSHFIETFSSSINNVVTQNDLRIISDYYGITSASTEWQSISRYDLSQDNRLDIIDLASLAKRIE